MIYGGTNTVVIATTAGFATGLTGTLGVRVVSLTGTTVKARSTAGITELVAGSGSYVASIDMRTLSQGLTGNNAENISVGLFVQ